MNKDTIYREDAIKAIFSKPACHGSDGSWYHSDDIRDAISSTPSADRPQGKWINGHHINGVDYKRCNQCFAVIEETFFAHDFDVNYCPNCGARMKGVDNDIK